MLLILISYILVSVFITYFFYYLVNCLFYYFPQLNQINYYKTATPRLSVLVPARNEEKNIKIAVDSILASDYPNLECIVLDDNSTDKTREILDGYTDKRLSVITGKPLPEKWIGKNWACHQLSQNAHGEIILFSDADTVHSKKGLSMLVKKMIKTNADLLSGIPKQIVKSFGEAITIPFIGLFSFGALPHFLFRTKAFNWTTASNGQYQCFKEKTYKALGGYKTISNILADDVAFPRLLKSKSKKVVYTNVSKQVSSRMYEGFKESFNGFAKSFYPTINESPLLAMLVAIVIFMFFLSPYLLLCFSLFVNGLICLIISISLWIISCINIHANPCISIFHPIVPFILIAMLIKSVFSYSNEGYLWKGRRYNK